MEIYIKIDNNSLSIPINDPFRLELDSMIKQINAFASAKGTNIDSLDIKGLVPKMVKGIAGCEQGCPADAKGLVSSGVKDFELEYIEGGILSARTTTVNGTVISIKMFPDF